jgi:sugar lactone lactonase YvrE
MPAGQLELQAQVEPFVCDPGAEVTEGLLWDERMRRLLWVDITAGTVNALTITTGERKCWRLGHEVGAVALRDSGGLVVADRDGFVLLGETVSEPPRTLQRVTGPGTRMNDGACDPTGCFWAGSMRFDEARGGGRLYRLTPGGAVDEMLSCVSISNGIGWTPDGFGMYYIDTPTRRVDRFDWAPGAPLRGRRRIVDLAGVEGAPDGLAVDADGCVWVAMWGGWCVRRYSPRGEFLGEISLPVAQVTSCAFGGEGMDELYIATAAHRLTDSARAEQPLAGAIFRCRPGAVGLPGCRYAG